MSVVGAGECSECRCDKAMVQRSLISQLCEELLLAEEAVLIEVGFLNELEDVVVADIDVQVLVEHCLDLVDANQSLLLAVEECEHVQRLLLPPPAEEPLLGDEIDHFAEGEGLLVLVHVGDLVLDLLAVHLGVGEVAQDAPQVLASDVTRIGRVVEREGVLDLVFLNRGRSTMSSESLLLRLVDLEPFGLLTFFFIPFISYKNINQIEAFPKPYLASPSYPPPSPYFHPMYLPTASPTPVRSIITKFVRVGWGLGVGRINYLLTAAMDGLYLQNFMNDPCFMYNDLSDDFYGGGHASGEDWLASLEGNNPQFRISNAELDLLIEEDLPGEDSKGKDVQTGAGLLDICVDHYDHHDPASSQIEISSVLTPEQNQHSCEPTNPEEEKKIVIQAGTLFKRSKIEKGDRFQTKNLCKHLHTETTKFLRNRAVIHQLSKEEVQEVKNFWQSSISIDGFKGLFKNAKLNGLCKNFYESKYFVQEILSSKMEMRTKLTIIKYLEKIRSLTYDKNFRAWKKDYSQ